MFHTPRRPCYYIDHLITPPREAAWHRMAFTAQHVPFPGLWGPPSIKPSGAFSGHQPILLRNSWQFLEMGGANSLLSQTEAGDQIEPPGHESWVLISRVIWASFMRSNQSVSLTHSYRETSRNCSLPQLYRLGATYILFFFFFLQHTFLMTCLFTLPLPTLLITVSPNTILSV